MSSLSEIFIKKDVLETMLSVLNKKEELSKDANKSEAERKLYESESKGIKITISLNDTSNDYGQNVSAFVSQTKEQREAKTKPFYIGNGKVFWTKGETPIGKKKEATTETNTAAGASDINPLGTKLPF